MEKTYPFSTRSEIDKTRGKNHGQINHFPQHDIVKNWQFPEGEKDEASLCHYLALVGAKNGIDANQLHKLFPAILRMLKSKSVWAE